MLLMSIFNLLIGEPARSAYLVMREMMKYLIKIHAIGKFPEIEINENKYKSICSAKEALLNGLEMEEKYEIFISNYLELEEKILVIGAQSMARNPYDYEDFFDVRMEFNIRMVNLLTAARLYKDQLHRHVRAIIPEASNIKLQIENLFSKEYDQTPEFRFMEELRNYVQHKGIPVHWTQHSAYSDDSGDKRLLIYSTELASQKNYLKEDKKFKKKVLAEIPDQIDLKISTRAYVESMSRVHCAARELVKEKLEKSREIIEFTRNEYKKIYQEKIVGLSVICKDGDSLVDDKPLILDWDDIRLKLTRRNTALVNLRNRFVTGKSKIS